MNESIRLNRRFERRYYHRSGETIAWRCAKVRYRRRRGWIRNVSESGIAFLYQGPRPPHVGADIELHDARQNQRLYRVVRTEPCEGDVVLIGCHADPFVVAHSQPMQLPELDAEMCMAA